MNRFILNLDPKIAAIEHCDKHVVKMILEEAQMLSTAHRILDGQQEIGTSASGRKVTRYRLNDDRDDIIYQAAHVNHPCTIWSRETSANYMWGFSLLDSLLEEYSFRYGKIHKTADLRECLSVLPQNISQGPLTPFAVAMPDDCKMPDAISAYRLYYKKYKSDFAVWTKRPAPIWFIENHVVESAK